MKRLENTLGAVLIALSLALFIVVVGRFVLTMVTPDKDRPSWSDYYQGGDTRQAINQR